ncbi:MAG: 30S ribosomal protein S12 methylthiotransferase RimO [Myxococcales bacterium]|nr:MAG: 30S ribosomal protein S12 methylthiotransferase RimO [Myxococcales bacterium]
MTQPKEETAGRRLYVVSLGCDKNLVDSEVLMGVAERAGCVLTADPEDADVILVNTCAFIGPAKEESIDAILDVARYKKEGRCRMLVVAGCLAQRYPDELAEELPEVDHFLGTGDLLSFSQLLAPSAAPRLTIGRPRYLLDADAPRVAATPFYTANVKVSEGCSSGCSFCIIPKLRGSQRSRPIDDLAAEVRRLKQRGVSEICLIGQDVSAYGLDRKDGTTLARLLREPELAQGDHWLRLHYLYPRRVDGELLDAIGEGEAILPYFDMPVQHIDDAILRAMERRDDEASTRLAVERIRARFPNGALRTTVIVGFPGETEDRFGRLLDFVAEGHFDRLGAFAYSPEDGTRAARLWGRAPEEVVQERLARLMETQREVSRRRLETLVGQTVDVLVEGPSEESELLFAGRMWSQARGIDGVAYLVEGKAEVGRIVPVRITEAHDHDVVGRILRRKPKGHRRGPD